jgi:predicted MPP superfamily phosphohydrolase
MKLPRFVTLVGTILLILFTMQIYFFQSFVRSLDAWNFGTARPWIVGGVLFLVCYLNLAILFRVFFRFFDHRNSKFVRYLVIVPGSTWMITAILLFVSALFKDLGLWFYQHLSGGGNTPETNLTVAQTAGGLSVALPLAVTGYGVFKTSRDYDVTRIDAVFSDLPPGLDGFTIAQVSDIHSGIYMSEKEMENIREIMDPLHPQIAALTGDFVDTRASEIVPVANVFSKIKTDYGVYACMGNHDLFDDYSKLSRTMKESGIVMLENSHLRLRVNGENLNILGIADAPVARSRSNFEQTLNGVDPDEFKILLAHRPGVFDRASTAGIDLQLSGHTHGGQIGVELGPLKLNPVYLFEKYPRGHYFSGKSQLYVNSGVGMVFAPIRISIRPEITLIRLKKAA